MIRAIVENVIRHMAQSSVQLEWGDFWSVFALGDRSQPGKKISDQNRVHCNIVLCQVFERNSVREPDIMIIQIWPLDTVFAKNFHAKT